MTLTLPPNPESVSTARHYVADQLQGFSGCTDAVLLVSELATNCVVHARSPYTIVVRAEADTVRVEVGDRSDELVPTARHRPLAAGRGLALVEQLATRWGVQPDGDGKVVWFELDGRG